MTALLMDLDRTELTALGVVVAACVGFGLYGFATGAPSTVAYLGVVVLVVLALVRWRAPLPAPVDPRSRRSRDRPPRRRAHRGARRGPLQRLSRIVGVPVRPLRARLR